MGVTYKLTEDVVAFILEQKHKSMDLSCRELVALVAKEFNRVVSKSSVHEVLKEANITSQRGRKYKNKFQIPEKKKAELIANLPPEIVANFPDVETSVETSSMTSKEESIDGRLKEDPAESEDEVLYAEIAPIEIDASLTLRMDPAIAHSVNLNSNESAEVVAKLPALQESSECVLFRDFLIKAAFYDAFPKPWGEVKTTEDFNAVEASKKIKESAYRKLAVANYKIELEDYSHFYIEARRHGLGREPQRPQHALSIETATIQMADRILNNLRPLLIRQIQGNYIDATIGDFLKSMDNVPEKRLSRIVLLDKDEDVLIDFTSIPKVRRTFIAGFPVTNNDVAMLMDKIPEKKQMATIYVALEAVQFYSHEIFLAGNLYRGIVLLSKDGAPQRVLVSNMELSRPDQSIVFDYMHAFTLESPQAQVAVLPSLEPDLLLTHALNLFGKTVAPDFAQYLNKINVRSQFNKELYIATIYIPDSYEYFEQINHACILLNNLNIIDHAGRKIWARVG